jgi:hypothetical protein
MVKEERNTTDVGDGVSARKSDTHQDIDISPVSLTEKRKYPGKHLYFCKILFILWVYCTSKCRQVNIQ